MRTMPVPGGAAGFWLSLTLHAVTTMAAIGMSLE
jgi:hypothetical protein